MLAIDARRVSSGSTSPSFGGAAVGWGSGGGAAGVASAAVELASAWAGGGGISFGLTVRAGFVLLGGGFFAAGFGGSVFSSFGRMTVGSGGCGVGAGKSIFGASKGGGGSVFTGGISSGGRCGAGAGTGGGAGGFFLNRQPAVNRHKASSGIAARIFNP
jgi:hypothetical protein